MAGRSGSLRVIIAAIAGNVAIAVCKFGAALFTGSAAMYSEAIHSRVDIGNELLLLFGMRRADKPPDAEHPFGYGLQLYFWVFVVAVMIFGLGALVAFYEGVEKILHPEPATYVVVNPRAQIVSWAHRLPTRPGLASHHHPTSYGDRDTRRTQPAALTLIKWLACETASQVEINPSGAVKVWAILLSVLAAFEQYHSLWAETDLCQCSSQPLSITMASANGRPQRASGYATEAFGGAPPNGAAHDSGTNRQQRHGTHPPDRWCTQLRLRLAKAIMKKYISAHL